MIWLIVIISLSIALVALEARRAEEMWLCPHCYREVLGGEICPTCGERKPREDA